MTSTIPAPAQQPVEQKNGRATASLILGIVSLLFNPLAVATILGVVFGILGIRAAPALGGRNKAIVGILLSVVGFFVGIAVFFSIVGGIGSAANSASRTLDTPAAVAPQTEEPSQTSPVEEPSQTTPADDPTEEAPAEEAVPVEYTSALNKAQSYVDQQYLSEKRLYTQLTSEYGEQFSKKAARYAVEHVDANYKRNALEKARGYQEQQSLSPARIREQLTSSYGEQFTDAQADYALKHLNG